MKRRGVHHDFALSHAAEDGGDGRATKETTLHAQQRDTPEEAIPSAAAESPQVRPLLRAPRMQWSSSFF